MKVSLLILILFLSACTTEQELRAPNAAVSAEQVQLVAQTKTPLAAAIRMIIRTASVSLVVENPVASIDRIVSLVESQTVNSDQIPSMGCSIKWKSIGH